jgi:hypothetical protein
MSGYANSILGGMSNLIRAAIRSPNYAPGVTGWTVNKDGSAEFNNLVVRNGQIISGSALYYSSPTPAANTLVASIAAVAGTDTAGNVYLPGIVTYSLTGSGQYMAIQSFGAAIGAWTAASMTSGAWTTLNNSAIGFGQNFSPLQFTGGPIESIGGTAANPTVIRTDDWHTLAPVNGWANAGGGLAQLQYKMMPSEEVWLIGVISPAAFTSTIIATLPAGYRPTGAAIEDDFEFHTAAGAGSGCFLRIGTGGTIQAINGVTTMGAVGINTRIPLDTIT